MALSIKDDEADRLAREIARTTGESLTQVVVVALKERLGRLTTVPSSDLTAEIERIGRRIQKMPILDQRTAEEILGYDENGLPQ